MRKLKPLHIAFALCGLAWLLIVLNAADRARNNPDVGREPVASQDEIEAFARQTLSGIQEQSFGERREFCGLILEDAEGALSISRVEEGEEAECDLPWILPLGQHAVATFHTHGAYDVDFDSEVPSVTDIESDIAEKIDGYVATPGGRLWHIDWESENADLVCGERCLGQDPNYKAEDWNEVADSYSLAELKDRQSD